MSAVRMCLLVAFMSDRGGQLLTKLEPNAAVLHPGVLWLCLWSQVQAAQWILRQLCPPTPVRFSFVSVFSIGHLRYHSHCCMSIDQQQNGEI